MRRSILLFVACVLLSLASVNAQGKSRRAKSVSPLSRARQLVLVTTRDWDAVQGTLRRFERKNAKAKWQPVGAAVPVVVGRGGLGWGPGRGSCIFMHIWAGPEKGTAGCTAMEQPNLEELMRWLDAKKRPLLAQLPEAEYARLRAAWKLPARRTAPASRTPAPRL